MRYSDELYHHGILGMKWGIRRYQNEDGTLTPAGRKRYMNNPRAVKKTFSKTEDAYRNLNRVIKNSNSELYELAKKYRPQINIFGKDRSSYTGYNSPYMKYRREITKLIISKYSKELNKKYGEMSDLAGLGREWLDGSEYRDIIYNKVSGKLALWQRFDGH